MPMYFTTPIARAAIVTVGIAGAAACDFSTRILPPVNQLEAFEMSYRVLTVNDVANFTVNVQNIPAFDQVLGNETCAYMPSFDTQNAAGGAVDPPDFNYQGAGTDGLSVSVTTSPTTIDTATGNPSSCPGIRTVNFQMGGPGEDLGSGRRVAKVIATAELADGREFDVKQIFSARLTFWDPSIERLVGEVRFLSQNSGTREVILGRAEFTITRD